MNNYDYSISLRIWHPNMNPEYISSTLKVEPTHSKKAGDERSTPKGKPLPGINEETYFSYSIHTSKKLLLEEAIEAHLADLAKHKQFIEEILDSGGRLSYFIGMYLEGNAGLALTHSLLKKVSDLGIGLDLDIYPSDSAIIKES